MKYTVFYDQINRTNYQVDAETERDAIIKADKLYRKRFELPTPYVQTGWISESDGEDE